VKASIVMAGGPFLGDRRDRAHVRPRLPRLDRAWVGMIALMGLDAETGVFMLLFLDLSLDDARREGRLRGIAT
jgi:hypothetical protein